MPSPIQYTSRTYNTILNDINSDSELVDKPEWFKRLIAGLGDMLSMINNLTANQSYLRTAFTRQAVKDLLELIDYTLTQPTTSNGYCIFHLDPTVVFPVTFTASELKAISQGTSVASSKKFEARSGEVVASSTGAFTYSGADNILTVASDFTYTGHKVRVSTTATLPTGLSAGTDYYVIRVSATEIKLATSVTNAFLGTAVAVTGAGAGVHTWTLFSFSKLMYQQDSKDEQTIGTSDGITEWQEFQLPDEYVIPDTLILKVGSDTYSEVTTLVDSTSTDKHFKLVPLSENSLSVRFGDGTYGILPSNNTVTAEYAVGGGTTSNLSNYNKITVYTGGSSNIQSITNPTYFTGGSDEEGIASAKVLGPLLLKAQNRFITVEDGQALALNYGGLSLVKVNKNVYGLGSVQVVGIASGGGNPSGTVKTNIEDYLTALTVLGEVNVQFDDATLTTVIVTSAVKVISGYVYADIEDYILLAWKMFFSETGYEIISKYNDDGLTDAITLINTIFSTTFTEASDGVAIQQLIEGLIDLGYRNFGDDIQESDAFTYIQGSVDGIDYMTITLPAFPISLADDEITTHTASTFNISQIL